MNISRIELAKMDANKVRRNPALFANFKTYVTEDAKYLYPAGRLPSGCFGCQFQSLFQKWKSYILYPVTEKTNKKMAKSNSTYELKDKHTKVYFEGKILSSNSSSEDWNRWINYPVDETKVQKRKDMFVKLPIDPNGDKPTSNTLGDVEPTTEVESTPKTKRTRSKKK